MKSYSTILLIIINLTFLFYTSIFKKFEILIDNYFIKLFSKLYILKYILFYLFNNIIWKNEAFIIFCNKTKNKEWFLVFNLYNLSFIILLFWILTFCIFEKIKKIEN